MNTIAYDIQRFAKRIKLNEQDVYNDLRNFTLNKYKNANLELIQMEDNVIDIKNNIQNSPYYNYTSLFTASKIEYIG